MVDFSLIIATRNRATRLEKCLDAISQLRTNGDWELVIVDNAATDDTAAVIREFKRQAPMAVSAAYEAKPGLGRARNRGLSVARGTIVGFTDDDCYPTPDYIDGMLDIFRDREIGYAGGRIKLFNPRDWPISIVDEAETRIIEPFTYIDGPEMKILGANMAFRRAVLTEIGGFDDALGAGGPFVCEDVDAFARASFAGWKGGYFPGPTVLHDHGRDMESARLARAQLCDGARCLFREIHSTPRQRAALCQGMDPPQRARMCAAAARHPARDGWCCCLSLSSRRAHALAT